ncbi:LOW QUALITY PROTEIN: uncharacterized protein [Argopecten irradians]|uniref:LOW QUALITY PROTEIN: uncharacterized protein n=1 Tax=Argopecten irradians TaxID=31199 RepID=UPI00371B94CC
MGVDLVLYRARIGTFVPVPTTQVLSNIDFLCKAVARVRHGLTHDKLDMKGAVTFIGLLLRIQGIESNPGPRNREQQSLTEQPPKGNNDINITLDSNVNPVGADRVSQFMEALIPIHTGSSVSSENAGAEAIPGTSTGAVAIPGTSSGAVSNPTALQQVNITYIDKRKYKDEIKVETMKVKHAENLCTGEQTVVHTEATVEKENDDNTKAKPKSQKRILLEENADTMLKVHIEETEAILVTRIEAEKAVVQSLKDYNMVMISGVTGEGKTTLGREVCRKLRDGILDDEIKAKTPVIVTTPQDWGDVVNDKDDIVVFVDDMFGKTNFQLGLLNDWKPFFERILASLRLKNVCMVATSRTHILKDARRESGVLKEMVNDHFLSEKKTVDLTDDMRLTDDERLSIYEKYFNRSHRNTGMDIFSSLLGSLSVANFPSKHSIGFAQICKLFFTNDTFFKKGELFFMHPDRTLTEEIEKTRLTEPHKYFALVYCFLKDHSIDTKSLNRFKMPPDDYNTLKLYAEVCGVAHTDNVLTVLKHALDALDGTYLTRRNTVFTFSHQSIADSVSLLFGKENPGMILEKCSDRVILELLDVSEDCQDDMCTLYVPPECYKLLAKRIHKMITKSDIFGKITLESFPRFRNQKLADCLFEFITTEGDTKAFLRAHRSRGFIFFRTNTLLESCASNVFFLRAFFRYNMDEFIVKEEGFITYVRALQRALLRALERVSLQSMSVLLKKGAFLTEKCLEFAISSNNEKLVKFVLSKNIWTDAEVKKHISEKTPDHIREVIKESRSECKVKVIKDQYIEQKTYTNTKALDLTSLSPADMTRAADEMDFDVLHAIFQSPELAVHRYRLLTIILDSKHKMLSDVITIKKIFGLIDGKVVQHALHSCNLDMFRFLLFSSNVDKPQLDAILSQAIHLNKTGHVEVLIRTGCEPSHDDFVRMAGLNIFEVENIVEVIMKTANWTASCLNDALAAAVNSGVPAAIEKLFEGGARFNESALMSVSKRCGDPVGKSYKIRLNDNEELRLLWHEILTYGGENLHMSLPDIFIPKALTFDVSVPETVEYVFCNHDWSQEQINDAIHAALDSGSLGTVRFLEEKGGTFRSDALSTAVRRTNDVKTALMYVKISREWSVDQLTEALHLALVLCRPDVVQYLNENGAIFNDSSLKDVLQWNVEHHSKLKMIKFILKARNWSHELLDEAIYVGCERKEHGSLLRLLLRMGERDTVPTDVLLNLKKNKYLKEAIMEILESNDRHDELASVVDEEIRQGNIDVVEHWLRKLNSPCHDDSLLNSMENAGNYGNYDAISMVRLVVESRSWSTELLMKAMSKALRLGNTGVVFYLHEHGATFSDQSLEDAIKQKPAGYDSYPLAMYVLEHRHFSKEQINTALQMCIKMGLFKLMKMLFEKGAEFTDKGLESAIHKNWKSSDRHPAVEIVLNARQWDTAEKNAALFNAVKLGDIKVIKSLMRCGGVVSRDCLMEVLERKCKPSHRLSLVRLLVTGSLSQDLLIDAREKARLLSESKVELYIQQFILD